MGEVVVSEEFEVEGATPLTVVIGPRKAAPAAVAVATLLQAGYFTEEHLEALDRLRTLLAGGPSIPPAPEDRP